ncbi:acetylornithine deacetylase/succinyl-diaminopimelate desuccinylase family protein [Mesorhizobium sp. M7A.F.Ca.CA.001.07.2.1]|uniref:acetylornithine deacetylase/succinyl-diaminopimelate desuccinylase family protein n=4 Tax=Phyllobacteriaceae TaxID=69277 RepID=UPI000FCA855B|nr:MULTISPECIES: acetylornithine deacetylase/succinyl-diaminopimelate desuccinylase family protein [Mesorhizobium]RVB40539.1 acetylornithine deacetylase/succinyl-diaminopimelate desuccinylase family protein [Mesorhizobium sp. M7A.F.Ca.CA.004.05.1.1]MCF6126817.1 acetylornithine deacetylase/succinyl-diaminopimelate desuccinylase family protein [Mesorhizobium ciceri]MCQ8816368.1 acetylornithine deacetylase/succinyl-diaminopimelate desuccinylase family protein [Mesorhizobium sp. SEMIA396]RUX68564.1
MNERLLRAIDDRRDDVVALTTELIRFPTINPPGEAYRPCAEYLGARLKKSGFETEFIRAEGTPGDTDRYPRVNVVARFDGRSSGACVHFNSHIDVVEAGDGWTVDPFAGIVKDGKVYGRGACDMKGGLAASIIAAEAFLEVFPDFPGAIEISGTVDEESGGFGGVAHLARLGYFSKPRVDHVIIPEPLNKDRICLGHRGVWWAEIETKGEIAHGSMPFLGDNAVRHMGAVLRAFEDELFPALDRKMTRMPVVPEGAKRSTMNINSIHGGQTEDFRPGLPSPNVPDSCRLTIDRRFLLEEDLDTVKGEVTGILDRLKRERTKFDYEIRDLMEVLPLMTERDAPVVKAVAQGIMAIFDREPGYVISPGTYDQKHIARIGHIYDCIAYGPGILDLAHRPDEWVGIADMVESAKVMAIGLNVLLRGTAAG